MIRGHWLIGYAHKIMIPLTPSPISNPVAPTYILGNIIGNVIGLFIFFGTIVAFIFLLIGGVQWITSGGDKAGVEAARNRIIHAIVGLIIIAATWAIVSLIFPALGLSFPEISLPGIGKGT